MAESELKSGFLVKKGRSSHRWKTRWFALGETSLGYFKKADRARPIGLIPLSGACVISPVKGYEKRQGIFKLSTRSGREYLLRAPTDEERDIWTHAVGAIIRQVEGMVQGEASNATKKLSSRVNLSDVLGAMQDPDAGVAMTTSNTDGATYENSFSGYTVVDWLLKWSFVSSREDAVSLVEDLVQLAHIQPLMSTNGNGKDKSRGQFMDSSDIFYRFSAWTRIENPDFILDSSSEDSGSSAGEFSEGDVLDEKPKEGKTVKEGFLLKRGHLRKKWKARKIVLKENPATLEYYAASKDSDPLKTVSVEGAVVLDTADKHTASSELPSSVSTKRQHVFCLKLNVDKVLVFQAENEHLKEEWIKVLNRVCFSNSQ